MKQNDTSKLQQLLGSKKTIERVAKSPDAKALAQMLTKGRDETSLKQAAESCGMARGTFYNAALRRERQAESPAV